MTLIVTYIIKIMTLSDQRRIIHLRWPWPSHIMKIITLNNLRKIVVTCITKLSKKIKMILTYIVKITTLNNHWILSKQSLPLKNAIKMSHLPPMTVILLHIMKISTPNNFRKVVAVPSRVMMLYKKIMTLIHIVKVTTTSDFRTIIGHF